LCAPHISLGSRTIFTLNPSKDTDPRMAFHAKSKRLKNMKAFNRNDEEIIVEKKRFDV